MDREWRAKQTARERIGTVAFQYRRLYQLPENDPRFLDMTLDEMLADIWSHRFSDNPKLLDEIEDDDFDPDSVASISGADPAPDDGDWEDF